MTIGPISAYCRKHNLLQTDSDFFLRVPFLIKGKLRLPPEVDKDRVKRAFEEKDQSRDLSSGPATSVRLNKALVLREPVIDRSSLRPDGRFQYSVLPVFEPGEVVETDTDKLVRTLYSMPLEKSLDLVAGLAHALESEAGWMEQVQQTTLATSEHPDKWHEAGFASLMFLLDPEGLKTQVEQDLSSWGISGQKLLDGWCDLPEARVMPAPVNLLATEALEGYEFEPRAPQLRAMPTRQLHITAGNAPQIPVFSALRALATKGAAVIKSPFGATAPGAVLSLALGLVYPNHPACQNLSIVYWPGGEKTTEEAFFSAGAFDRILVWGAPDAVESVKKRALFTKVLSFNPRYGVSFIGKQALKENLEQTAKKAVCDSLVANQKACIASQIHYIEADRDMAIKYAQLLRQNLARFDELAPNYIAPFYKGEIKRLQRGIFLDADWHANTRDGLFTSGAILVNGEFPLKALTMNRMVVVRPVDQLEDVLPFLHAGVSTVGMAPEARKDELRDRIAARGVSNILELGQAGSGFSGQSHDGMMVLTELVDWKNG